MISLRAMMMRGGTSKGLYLLKPDLDAIGVDPDVLLPVIMGSPDGRQIDGVGGGSSTTSKVAIVGPSTRPDCDVDYLFAQVDVASTRVDWTPTCGNLLAGVGLFAIERGLVVARRPQTVVRVHLVNTGATARVSLGVPPGPIRLVLSDFHGGRTGRLLPIGRPVERIGGVALTAIDAAVCTVVADAHDFDIAGDESPQRLNADRRLLERLERVRLGAALAMGMGDASGSVLPKVMLVSRSGDADIRSRYFVPDSCHPAHALSGAVALATAATIRGSVVAGLLPRDFHQGRFDIEHPAGVLTVEVGGRGAAMSAAVHSTARKLFDGYVFAELGRKAG
jgi:4-oxalomesaconate tautomerase